MADDIGRIKDKANGQAKVQAEDGTTYETDNAQGYNNGDWVRFVKDGGNKVSITGPASPPGEEEEEG